MTDAELERQRKLLREAFTAGWQAALAVKVTNPAVLAVVESCFELWLEEEVDERGVFGLPFRRRYDLPRPRRAALLWMRGESFERPVGAPRRTAAGPESAEPVKQPDVAEPPPSVTELPRQREHSDSEEAVEASRTGS